MNAQGYLEALNIHLSQLFAFARQMNELDFAASLSGEFRGAQDAGWTTTITANEVFGEILPLLELTRPLSKAEFRVVLMLYCQLAEAGGVYETLKNMMGVITLKPYLLWPFKDLVKVRPTSRRVIGPNANVTFRDLATAARDIGLARLSELFELAFRDDIRNGISHADYIIWIDGLRLRKRNGGYADRITFEEVANTVLRGLHFFEVLRQHSDISVRSFHPPKTIVGRFSANPPMPWTVSFDPDKGTFGIGRLLLRQHDQAPRLGGLLQFQRFRLFPQIRTILGRLRSAYGRPTASLSARPALSLRAAAYCRRGSGFSMRQPVSKVMPR